MAPACTMHHVMLDAKTSYGARPLWLCSSLLRSWRMQHLYKEFHCACLCHPVAVHASLSV